MADPSWFTESLPSVVGGLIGGGFALAGSALSTGRAARHDRHRVEREDLVRLAAEMIRNSDAMWVADIDYLRAVFTLSNAEGSGRHADDTLRAFQEQASTARGVYVQANDTMRSLAAEMRLRQPGIAQEAEALWRASMVPNRGAAAGMSPSDDGRRKAESEFIAKVRARMDELQ